jgi:hypothetical protein
MVADVILITLLLSVLSVVQRNAKIIYGVLLLYDREGRAR